MPNVEGMMGIRLSVLHHHPLAFAGAGTKTAAAIQHSADHPRRELRRGEIQIEITLHRLNVANGRDRADVVFYLLRHLAGTLRNRQPLALARLGLVRSHLKERNRNAPLSAKRNGRPFQLGFRYIILLAKRANARLDGFLFYIKHRHSPYASCYC